MNKPEFKGTSGPWLTYFNELANPVGWMIKQADGVQVPVAIVPEPQGGLKNEAGLSPKQIANAKLIAAAPELLAACIQAIELSDKRMIEENTPERSPECQAVYDNMLEAILKATT